MLLRRMLIMLAAVIAVVAILAGYKVYSIRQQIALFSAPKPPISVTASLAEKRPWQSRLPAIGSLKAFQGVTLTAEVSGTVRDVLFLSGDQVKLDQPLIQLESDVEEATLRTAEADLGLARAEYQRGRELIGSKAISKSEFDRLAAQWAKTSATVAELKAALAKKRVLAPFAGTIGIRQVDVGDYVSPGTPIATLQDLSTLLLDFHLPEQDFPLLSRGQLVKVRVAAYPAQVFDAEIAAINRLVGGDLADVTLENFAGKRKVLNIFPSVDTPTCATSVRKFNVEAGKLANTVVLCISADLPFAQKRFCGAEGLENVVNLSTLRGREFLENYGVAIASGPLAGLAARAVVVLDEQNKVLHSELVGEIADEPNYAAALAAL